MKVGHTGSNQVQGTDTPATRQTGRGEAAGESKKAGRIVERPPVSTDDARPEISAKGREFAQAKAVANEAPDVREDKIADIKRRIAEGKYNVSADKIADRMVDEHISTGGLG
jgi:negative regulator of flagellin synthesis FlgM